MSFTLMFVLAALLIPLIVIVFIKKGWKAALLSGFLAFIVLAAFFVLMIVFIAHVMSGNFD